MFCEPKEVDSLLDGIDTSIHFKPKPESGLTSLLQPMRAELDAARFTCSALRQKYLICLVQNDYKELNVQLLEKFGKSIWHRQDCKPASCHSVVQDIKKL